MANEDAKARLAALEAECTGTAAKMHLKGRFYYWASYALMLASLAGSVGAGLLAFATGLERAWIGAIALVPAFCAMAAGQLRLVEKSNWFYRRQREMNALARRVAVARMRAPNVETLETCYGELALIDKALGEEWANDLAFDFAAAARKEQG